MGFMLYYFSSIKHLFGLYHIVAAYLPILGFMQDSQKGKTIKSASIKRPLRPIQAFQMLIIVAVVAEFYYSRSHYELTH